MNFPNTPKAEPVRAEKTKKIGNFGIIFGIIKPHLLILGLALFLGIITRFYFLTSYIQFDGEQARSGFILMKMWQGDWPTLGAPSSIGGYGIFPYYYYWTFLWTLLGSDPVFQVLSNAVPSFGSILLIFTITYKLLHPSFIGIREIWFNLGKNSSREAIIASFASLFYALFYTEILYSQMEWNPNGGTFGLFLMILILEKFWQTGTVEDTLEGKKNNKFNLFLILCFGLIINILLSLHSSFLFVVPVFLVLFGLFWLLQKKNLAVLLISLSSVLLFSLPYWFGEFGRGFGNTLSLIKTLIRSSQSHTWLQKLDRFLFSTLEIGKLAYFPQVELYLFSNLFLGLLIFLTLIFYPKIKHPILNLLGLFWGIFLLITINFWGILHTHYLVILWSFPCLLTAILINFFLQEFDFQNFPKNLQKPFKKYFWTKFPAQLSGLKDGQKDTSEATKNSENKAINQTLNNGRKFEGKKVFHNLNFVPIILFLLFGSILSFGVNINKTWEYGQTKFGQKRLTSSQDMVETLKILPENAKICLSKIDKKASLEYISLFVVKKNQQIYLCSEKQSEFIFWEKWSGWEMSDNQKPADLKILPVFYRSGNIEILENGSQS